MLDWIKEHPYLTGGGLLALVVLIYVYESSSSGSSSSGTVSGPDDATIQAELAAQVATQQTQAAQTANTNQLNASLQALALQNQGQTTLASAALQQAQIQGTTQTTLGNEAVSAQDYQVAAGVQTAGITANAGVQENTSDIAGAESLAGTQAQVTDAQTAAALSDQQMIDAASESINAQNQKTSQQQISATSNYDLTGIADSLTANQQNDSTALQVNQANLTNNVTLANIAAGIDSQLGILNAGVQNNAITANTNVEDTSANDAAAAIEAEIAAGSSNEQQLISYQTNLNSQAFSAASSLGPNNKAATISSILGQPGVGEAEIQGQPGTGTNAAQILAGIGSLFAGAGKIAGSVFG